MLGDVQCASMAKQLEAEAGGETTLADYIITDIISPPRKR